MFEFSLKQRDEAGQPGCLRQSLHFHKWQIHLWRPAATRTESEDNFFLSGVAPFTTFPLSVGTGISVTLVTGQDNASPNTSFLHLELTLFKCTHPTEAVER